MAFHYDLSEEEDVEEEEKKKKKDEVVMESSNRKALPFYPSRREGFSLAPNKPLATYP